MRINQRIAQLYPDISRRKADTLITDKLVYVNGNLASVGDSVSADDNIVVKGYEQPEQVATELALMHKPTGYIVSRQQQGDVPTIYQLLPEETHHLNYAGRLDKDSRGLILLTSDGDLLQKLTHPSHQKDKLYQIATNKPIDLADLVHLNEGIYLEDGLSRLEIVAIDQSNAVLKPSDSQNLYHVTMREGKNRQIRRTLQALGYEVTDLLRLQFGDYHMGDLKEGEYRILS